MKSNRAAGIFICIMLVITVGRNNAHAWEVYDILNGDIKRGGMPVDTVNGSKIVNPLNKVDIFTSVNDLSVLRIAPVRKHLYLYLYKGRPYVRKAIEQSRWHIDIIKEEFNKNPEVPKDLMYLPLLESAFNTRAVSRSRAVGLWQFLVTTSTSLGLKTDRWVDERRDVARSTATAIRYLKELHTEFGNWELALAAYNGGNGYLNRVIAKTGTRDYWKLRENGALRRETAEFVPRYLALLIICKNQDLFSICNEIAMPDIERTVLVELTQQVRIADVSRFSGVDVQVLKNLNPALNSDLTPPDVERYQIRITEKGAAALKDKLAELYAVKIPRFKTHVVRRGESLTLIAQRYRGSVDGIMRHNRLKNPSMIQAGMVLYVPY